MDEILVEIVCHIAGHETSFSVSTSQRNTIAGLLRKCCKDNGLPMRSSYTLKDSKDKILQWSQTLVNCGIKQGDVLHMTIEDEDVHTSNGCTWNSWWFVAAISLLIGGVGVTAITILFTRNGEIDYQYGVVMDAGSSHTKLFVYKWNGEKLHNTAVARQVHVCTVKGKGISSYALQPANLSEPFTACLDEAKHVVPLDKRKDTPIFLGATAGMRMLDEVDTTASEAILAEIRKTIKKSPFYFQSPTSQARIISGQEEGTFGWVTANYVSGTLHGKPELTEASGTNTVGALDMGGASTQITFYTPTHEQMPPDYKEDLVLYGDNYSVYTHSYLCYGINEAIRRYQAILVHNQGLNETNVTNPCGPSGNVTIATYSDIFEAPCANRWADNYIQVQSKNFVETNTTYTFYGTGNETECQSYVKMLFNFSAPCPQQPCTFNGTYQPPVSGQFYAFSSFFYEMDFLNLTKKDDKSTLKDFTTDLTKLCNTPWDEVEMMKAGNNGSMLGWYCFEGHFIHTLLTQGYKFNEDTWSNIHFIQKINKTDIGWTLGYMLNSSNILPTVGPDVYITTTAFSALTVLFVIFLLLSVGFGCYARKHQQQKTSLYERVPTYGAV